MKIGFHMMQVSDYVLNNEFVLYGSKVIIFHLNHLNVNCYLSIYKSASDFSKVYEMMPDF